MAVDTQVTITINGKDEASAVLKNIGSQFKSLGDGIQGIGAKFADLVDKSKMASTAFSAALAVTAKSVINVASEMQQAKVAFDTMLGSAQKGSQILSEISDFAKKTPFDLPQVVEGSKRLLAYNIEAKNIIPTFEMLGNISAGIGTDKLPQLITAFGQVKAATKLTGAELRQFSEAGVPLLQALVDQANKAGGVLTQVGGASKKTKADIGELNFQLSQAKLKLQEATQAGGKKQSQMNALQHSVDTYSKKLNEANASMDGSAKKFVRVKVTAAEMLDQISDGNITFDQVQKALAGMTGEGGKFFNLMEKQSQTFSGRMSNLKDNLTRVALNIAGISTEAETFGQVIQGGAFDILSQAAQRLLNVTDALAPKIKPFLEWFTSNSMAMSVALGALAAALLPVVAGLISFLAPLIALAAIGALVGGAINLLYQGFQMLGNWFITVLVPTLIQVKDAIVTFVMDAITWFTQMWTNIHNILQMLTSQSIMYWFGFIAGWLSGKVSQIINNTIQWFSQLPGRINTILTELYAKISSKFTEIWNWVSKEVSTWPSKISGFLEPIPAKIGSILENLKSAFFGKLGEIWNFVNDIGNKIIGTFNAIKDAVWGAINAVKEGFKAGIKASGVSGYDTGGIVPGPVGAPVPIMAHGGEKITPAPVGGVNSGGSGNGGGSVNLTVHIGLYAGTEVEKRNIARDLYASLLQVAKSQNKTVAEFMNG